MVSLVILIFLRHLPSAFVAVAIIPATLLIALIPMLWFGVNLNIMSLGGIVLSIGVLVDGAIIEVENVYRRLKLTGGGEKEILRAMEEVTPAVFLSLLTITVTFFPIFALTGQEGRLFQPLAAAKTIVMATAALMTVTLAPALRMLFAGGMSRSEPRWQSLDRSEADNLRIGLAPGVAVSQDDYRYGGPGGGDRPSRFISALATSSCHR